jgi:hypothetical protein
LQQVHPAGLCLQLGGKIQKRRLARRAEVAHIVVPAAAGHTADRYIRAACRALNQLVQRAISTAGIQRRRGTGCRILAGCFAGLTGILCDNNLRLGQLELAGRRLDPGHKLCACIPFSCNGVDEKYLFHRGAPSAQWEPLSPSRGQRLLFLAPKIQNILYLVWL